MTGTETGGEPVRRRKDIHPNNAALRNPKFAQQVFDSARRPIVWLLISRRLRLSAELIFEKEYPIAQRFYAKLRDDNRTDEVFDAPNFEAGYMLVAYSIENLLKGLMIAKGIVSFKGTEYPNSLKGHDLKKLNDLANPTATITSGLLYALTYMSEWRARYPLPLELHNFWPMDEAGDLRGTGFSWPGSHEEFQKCSEGLDAELKSHLSPNEQDRIDELTRRNLG